LFNDIQNELKRNFIEYAAAVNCDRALPDAKSGLKPVARRILWSAYENKRLSSKPHVKAARIVGDTMAAYHPHGDSSIYGAMVRLSQPWVMRYPLIDWHGNNGNIAGDGPAAARYTEARLSKIAEEGMLNGIKKNNVDFIPNYDETLGEPVTLPAVFPNLLCNPNTGIGVAMACNWAPHNLNDVAKAVFDYLDGITPMLDGPDFPTGGLIINKDDIPKIMKTGHGTVKIQARYNIEGNKIIFYEVPYGETIEGLIAQVGKACEDKEIEGISDIHDESSKKIRIVVTCEKGVDPSSIVAKLYNKTNFQSSFSYNQVALIDKTPTELNLEDAIKIYVDHNLDCIVKECNFDLTKAEARLEIVNGLLKALEDIDNIIALIKASESAAAAKINLIAKYNFTENQAKAILAMRLSSLAKLEKVELNKEAEDLNDKIFMFHQILDNRDEQIGILKVRLQGLVNKYGDARRTELAQIEVTKEEKEKAEIIPEDVVVIINNLNEVKRIPKKSFKVQHRRGVGVKTASESTKIMLATNTVDTLMIFTSEGKMYRLNVDKIPEGTNASRGVNLKTILKLDDKEIIQEIASAKGEKPADYVVFFTKNGLIKKTKFEEYVNTKKTTGIQAIKIKDNDELAFVRFMNDNEKIILVTEQGYAIKFTFNDIKPIGRLTSGVKGINLRDGDGITGAINFSSKDDYVVLITEKGKSKRMLISDFTIQNRGGRGNMALKLDSDDYVAAALKASEEDAILIAGKPNSICVPVKEISIQSKLGSGTKIIERSQVESAIVV
jgi:DNA gyrase subunit A